MADGSSGWSPLVPLLGSYREGVQFSFVFTYTDDTTGIPKIYNATLTPIDKFSETVVFQDNRMFGYFSGEFQYNLNYIDKDEFKQTVQTFDKIPDTARQITNYSPSMVLRKTMNLMATVPNVPLVPPMSYQIIVINDWTSGRNSLRSILQKTDGNE